MNYKLMIILFLAFLTSIFIFQNAAEIDVRFLVWSLRMSQVLLMAIIFVVGILLGWLFSSYLRLRSRHKAKQHDMPIHAKQGERAGTTSQVANQETEAEGKVKDSVSQ